MKRLFPLLLGLGAAATVTFLGACGAPRVARSLADAPVFERGFQIFPSPRTFDPPGTVFRLDQQHVRHAVADLSTMLKVAPQDEAVPRLTTRGAFNAGAFFSWLGSASRGFAFERIDSAIVALVGARRERAFEVDLRRVVDSAVRVVDWSRGGRVFLITETVSADSVQIDVSLSLAASVGDSIRSDSGTAHRLGVQLERVMNFEHAGE